MQRALFLQSEMKKFCDHLIADSEFVMRIFESTKKLKAQFGQGFSFTNIGEYSLNYGKFTHPDGGLVGMWLDEDSTRKYISADFADVILASVNYDMCPSAHEIFVFMGTILNDEVDLQDNKYIVSVQSAYLTNLILKPSNITEKQIEKRLRRMALTGIKLLTLDTMHPDIMGENLGKWMRVIKAFKFSDGRSFDVIINSNSRFPGIIPSELIEDTLKISLNN